MIKIIKGTYGLKVDGKVVAMTKDSEPFSLDAAREDELVADGVAVKVEEPEATRERVRKPTRRKVAEVASEQVAEAGA